jgi:DNA recombination protein RmuC
MEAFLLGLVVGLLALVAVLLLVRRGHEDTSGAGVAQALASLDAEARRIQERLTRLEGLPAEAGRTAERLVRLEPVTQAVDEIRATVQELRTAARSREDLERRTAESVRRLELVIAGTQSRGAAGEQILDTVFARLPAEWQVRDFRVGNRVVEFGLRLPNDLVLPIDSKWTGAEQLARLAATEDPAERAALKQQIESAVFARAREVTKYLDPSITPGFGVAVVPDAVFELCAPLQVEALRLNVVLLSHSLFIPYLLVVFQSAVASAQSVDAQKLDAYLQSTAQSLDALQGELQGRLARAITMLSNSRDELSAQVSRARGGLTGLRIASGSEVELPEHAAAPPEEQRHLLDPADT